jgi:hypothetical protein
LVECFGGEGGEERQPYRGCVAVELGWEYQWPGAPPRLAGRSGAQVKRCLESAGEALESWQSDSGSELRGLFEGVFVGGRCVDRVGGPDRRLPEVGRARELVGIGFDTAIDLTRELG